MQQPLKIPYIASLVLVVNTGPKPEIVTELLSKIGQTTQEYVNTGSWREVKLMLRFLGCLQVIFVDGSGGVFPVLEDLFARAVDLQTASSEDVSILLYLSLLL